MNITSINKVYKYTPMIVPILLLSISQPTFAGSKEYQAKLNNSLWYISSSSPIECRLDHPIPKYGEAYFEVKASKKHNLNFFLLSKQGFPKSQVATLKSVPPHWLPGAEATKIAKVKFYQQFDGHVTRQNAWRILNELESGQNPTFYYKDWYNNNQVTTVGLSAINFSKSYNEFNNCVAQLLPYNFEDIAFSILKYDEDGLDLTTVSKDRLKMISNYIKYDEKISIVLVSGYSDSYGSSDENQENAKQRASAVKQYLADLGLTKDQIIVESHGEKHHVADNRDKLGRIKNRRVVISLTREVI